MSSNQSTTGRRRFLSAFKALPDALSRRCRCWASAGMAKGRGEKRGKIGDGSADKARTKGKIGRLQLGSTSTAAWIPVVQIWTTWAQEVRGVHWHCRYKGTRFGRRKYLPAGPNIRGLHVPPGSSILWVPICPLLCLPRQALPSCGALGSPARVRRQKWG
jgi:hypothetical protein